MKNNANAHIESRDEGHTEGTEFFAQRNLVLEKDNLDQNLREFEAIMDHAECVVRILMADEHDKDTYTSEVNLLWDLVQEGRRRGVWVYQAGKMWEERTAEAKKGKAA